MAQRKSNIVLQPVQGKKASEEIYRQIRTMILSGEIKPGERLPSERKMMTMVERSRPTIREAIRMLERDGYVKIIPGSSGALILESNVNNAVQSIEAIVQMQKISMDDIYEFRMVEEAMAVKYAAERRSDANLAKLDTNLQQMLEQVKKAQEHADEPTQYMHDLEKFIELDVEFHMLIAEAAENEMFSIVLQVCRNVLGRSLMEQLSKKSWNELEQTMLGISNVHEKILEGIAEKDAEKAQKNMHQHLLDAGEDVCYNIKK